jgi:hypothetical protein
MTVNELRNKLVGNYEWAIKKLMENDHNGTWDEILEEKENDYVESTKYLIECLKTTRDCCEDDEYDFYNEIIEQLLKIK